MAATDNDVKDFLYEVSEDGVTITHYVGQNKDVVIPSEIDGKKVNRIGYQAFCDCQKFKNITIPEGVIEIANDAFWNCGNLKKIDIPESVIRIGYGAFHNCESLEQIKIPKGVTEIKKGTFAYCENLKEIDIPDSVTKIGAQAFKGCENLGRITLLKDVDIAENAFADCDNLIITTIEPQQQVKGFVYEVSEAGITIKRYVGQDKDVVIPEEIDGKKVIAIGEEAFANLDYKEGDPKSYSPIVSIKIPDSVVSIGYHAFLDCTNLKNITLPESITAIADGTFLGCESLKEITIPESVTWIGEEAFRDCESLEQIRIPEGVTEINECTFSGCNSLKEITIPEGVTKIGAWAFDYCSNLESLTIPEGVDIDETAFIGCDKLTITTTEPEQQDMDDMEPEL